jgi:hypothetical protein
MPVDYTPQEKSENLFLDSEFANHITSALEKNASERPIEKVYLHVDKPIYAAGDTLYLKAYITLGAQHQPTSLSSILHVGIIDPKGYPISTIQLKIKDGLAIGDFTIPDTLLSGTYYLQAYTKWMLNAGQVGPFEQQIPIINSPPAGRQKPFVKQDIIRKTNAGVIKEKPVVLLKTDLQFFPEGGTLLAGVPAKISFKAIGTDGLGITTEGTIIDEQGLGGHRYRSINFD